MGRLQRLFARVAPPAVAVAILISGCGTSVAEDASTTECPAVAASPTDTAAEALLAACDAANSIDLCDATVPASGSCQWLVTRYFATCGDACSTPWNGGFCVAVAEAPSADCTQEDCPAYWRATPQGLYVIYFDFCAEVPLGWSKCGESPTDPAQCACRCPGS